MEPLNTEGEIPLESNGKVQIIDAPEASEIMATDEWSWEEG